MIWALLVCNLQRHPTTHYLACRATCGFFFVLGVIPLTCWRVRRYWCGKLRLQPPNDNRTCSWTAEPCPLPSTLPFRYLTDMVRTLFVGSPAALYAYRATRATVPIRARFKRRGTRLFDLFPHTAAHCDAYLAYLATTRCATTTLPLLRGALTTYARAACWDAAPPHAALPRLQTFAWTNRC